MAIDVIENSANVASGAMDVYQSGEINFSNGSQIVLGSVGVASNLASKVKVRSGAVADEAVVTPSSAFSGGTIVNTTEAVVGTNTIRTNRIMGRLKETELGLLIRENIYNGKISLVLDGTAFPPESIYGVANFTKPNQIGGIAKVFVKNTQTRELTFRTVVHESVHALGINNSRKAEVLARVAEIQALGRRPTMRDVMRAVREVDSRPDLYGSLPKRLGIPIDNPILPGTSF